MKYLVIFLFIGCSNAFAQDIIFSKAEKKIEAKIIEANDEVFKYKSAQNPDGPTYTIARSEIKEIVFENGSVEVFRQAPPPSPLSIEEVKSIILEKINTYAFDLKSASRPYRASFEGDYLKLGIMRSRGDEYYINPVLYDFSRAYDFQDISYRSNGAFINVFVGFLNKKGKVEKVKLVIRVLEQNQAEEIAIFLKIYNRFLAEKNIGID